jgi:phage-related holin
MWGQFFTLKYPDMTMLQAFKAAIPFAWADWFFITIAVGIAKTQKLFTGTQTIFILIITQFIMILFINKFFLKQPISRSDYACFAVIMAAFYISYENVVSYITGTPVPEKILEATGRSKKKSKDKKKNGKKHQN